MNTELGKIFKLYQTTAKFKYCNIDLLVCTLVSVLYQYVLCYQYYTNMYSSISIIPICTLLSVLYQYVL